jgi:hypothetical protein
LHPKKEADLFGLEILLGALAGARPFGEQTPTRVQARKDFHKSTTPWQATGYEGVSMPVTITSVAGLLCCALGS